MAKEYWTVQVCACVVDTCFLESLCCNIAVFAVPAPVLAAEEQFMMKMVSAVMWIEGLGYILCIIMASKRFFYILCIIMAKQAKKITI